MCRVSVQAGSPRDTPEKVCSGLPPFPALKRRATPVMDDESRPPLSMVPTGVAPPNRHRTASTNVARNASAYSSSDPQRNSDVTSGVQYARELALSRDTLMA